MMNNSDVQTCLFLHMLNVPDKTVIKSTAIITSIIGFFVAVGGVIGNAIILYIIIKFDRLQTPSNLLLGNLCVTDFITGIIVQPLSAIRRLNEAYNRHICKVRLVCAYFAFLCVVTSIVSVGVISMDRYYAITMPFRYQRNVTNARYICLIIALWLLLALFALLPFVGALTASNFFQITFGLMGFSITIFLFAYIMIHRIVRMHRRKIVPNHLNTITQESTTSELSHFKKERRKANTVAIIVFCAVALYSPLAIMFILRGVIGDTVELVTIADPWADLILHMNSVINPIIYCLRSKEIQEAIIQGLPQSIANVIRKKMR